MGGKVEKSDSETEVRNCIDPKLTIHIASAARELFEEVGVLLVRNGEKLTKGQRVSLHDDLISERSSFAEILEQWGLWLDANDFQYLRSWTTPKFSAIRFATKFFVAVCPPKQQPFQAISELQEIEFISPASALDLWSQSKTLVVPPVLNSLRNLNDSVDAETDKISISTMKSINALETEIEFIELNPRVICMPLKTKTLPPATTTNCFIVGKKEFIVIDAATRSVNEQNKLFEFVDSLTEGGGVCREIVVSHLHPDHFGGEGSLQSHLEKKFGVKVPISAHEITAKSLSGKVKIDNFIPDNRVFDLSDSEAKRFELKAIHSPGHARGHLCFYDEEFGFLLSSDNVVGQGTIVIAPPEGNMIDYLKSLEELKDLPNLNFLCGSHGSAVYDAKGKIENYISHRLEREEQILQIVRQGIESAPNVAERVYSKLDPNLLPLAEKSVEAHLEKLEAEGKISLAAQN